MLLLLITLFFFAPGRLPAGPSGETREGGPAISTRTKVRQASPGEARRGGGEDTTIVVFNNNEWRAKR
jgi:hypothetical protein